MEADPLHQIPKPKQTDDSIRNTAVNDVIDTKEYNIIFEVHYCRRFYLFFKRCNAWGGLRNSKIHCDFTPQVPPQLLLRVVAKQHIKHSIGT